jgi:hypothetical protein
MVKLRFAPRGGRGKGAARRSTVIAARSSRDDPELRASRSADNPPLSEIEKRTTAAPRLLARGRGTRAMWRITLPG